jgi:hypothetical protein
MTDSFPLTAAALRSHASDFNVYEHQLALELGGLSGFQINELAFARLTKPDPLRLFGSDCGGEEVLMLGTDQRDHAGAQARGDATGPFHRGDDPRLLGQIRAGSRGKGAQIADCAGSDDRAGERDAVSVGLPGVVAEALARNDFRVVEVLTQPTRIYGHDLSARATYSAETAVSP